MKNIKCSIEAFVNGNAKSGQESFEMAQEHIEELITKKIENPVGHLSGNTSAEKWRNAC